MTHIDPDRPPYNLPETAAITRHKPWPVQASLTLDSMTKHSWYIYNSLLSTHVTETANRLLFILDFDLHGSRKESRAQLGPLYITIGEKLKLEKARNNAILVLYQ